MRLCQIAVALGLLMAAPTAQAIPNQWRNAGPPGGFVRGIAVHPTDPQTAWVTAQPGGVFRTKDGGVTWQRKPVGHDPTIIESASFVAVDPAHPDVMLVSAIGQGGGGLWRSADAGETWVRAGRPGGNGFLQALVFAPGSPSVAFAGTTNGLYRSVDSGNTWQLVYAVPFQQSVAQGVLSVTVDPTNPLIVYAAGGVSGFLKSGNGGLTFSTGGGPAFAVGLAVDPSRSSVVYSASPFGGGVSRSGDGGVTWTFSSSGLTDTNAKSIAVDPAAPDHVWVACDGGGIFRSDDGAASWRPAAAGLTNPFGNAIAFGAGGVSGYAGFTGAGISRTTDHGASWTDARLPAPHIQKLAWSGSSLVAGVYGVGVELTSDRGVSWRVGSNGLDRPEFYDLAVSRRDPSHMAVGTFGAIYSSRDGGSTWTTSTVTNCQSVTWDAGDANVAYASLYPSGLLRTQDAGLTWNPIPDPNGPPLFGYVTLLRADPARPGVVLAASIAGIFRSTDRGDSWTLTGYPSFQVLALEFDAADSRYVYASDGTDLFRSADAGLTWARAGSMSPLTIALASVPGRAGSLYAAGGAGVVQSVDFGDTWTPVNSGLPSYNLTALIIDPANPSAIYVAVDGFGVYTLDRTGAPAGPCTADGTSLCLNNGRFRVRVDWNVPSQGTAGSGTAVALTMDTGYFWFFSSNNVELVIKVVDGTVVNGKYWFFSGALSDVAYRIAVLDTVTGEERLYSNPSGVLASIADTSAF